MPYTKQNWVDAPDGSTPIFAAQLNHIEDGIAAIDTTLATKAPPTWVKSTLLASLDAIAHPIMLTIKFASGWPTLDSALQNDSHFGWLFVGGTSATPPPTTVGPQVWDRPI